MKLNNRFGKTLSGLALAGAMLFPLASPGFAQDAPPEPDPKPVPDYCLIDIDYPPYIKIKLFCLWRS